MRDTNDVPTLQHHIQGNLQYLPEVNIRQLDRNAKHALVLSFKPLFAARMAFRECETFFFGTARRNGGKSSKSDWKAGMPSIGETQGRYREIMGKNPLEPLENNGNEWSAAERHDGSNAADMMPMKSVSACAWVSTPTDD